VTATIHIGALQSRHRRQIEEIVRATGVFNEDEVTVALEVFDAALGSALWAVGSTAPTAHGPQPKADYEFIGAFDGDALIGYACFGATPSTDRTYDLYWIAVHPNAQRNGAGSALMSEMERRLEERRARLVIIETSSRDDYAQTRGFYVKHGYEEAARLRDYYAPADDRLVLRRRLIGSNDPGGNAAARPLSA
jgi:ribosomal protein S18 acetylase RimI-like enzyme